MELLASCQGIEFLRPLKSSLVLEQVYKIVRKKVPRADVDRSFHEDLRYLENLIVSQELAPLIRECVEAR
jgi:histidine ammonia-lyase